MGNNVCNISKTKNGLFTLLIKYDFFRFLNPANLINFRNFPILELLFNTNKLGFFCQAFFN